MHTYTAHDGTGPKAGVQTMLWLAALLLELRRSAIAVNVTWPLSASGQCAAWLREILR